MFFLIEKILFSGLKRHSYHIVTRSLWPFFCSISTLFITVGAVMGFYFYNYGIVLLLGGFFCLFNFMGFWWVDIIRESTFLGYHTKKVLNGLKIGMLLFIISEIMFFFSFFWAFFHASLVPSFILGSVWPPVGINILYPWHIPFLNTFILLASGFLVTVFHYGVCLNFNFLFYRFFSLEYLIHKCNFFFLFIIELLKYCTFFRFIYYYVIKLYVFIQNLRFWQLKGFFYNFFEQNFTYFLVAIFLAFEFTFLQFLEYYEALFYIYDNIYGSSFYLITGFHGLHVIIGTVFLIVCFLRFFFGHFIYNHHLGLEFAIWYWHFVDVVWLFLFVIIYVWGTGLSLV